MDKEAPEWLVEVCRRMGWDVSEWSASENGDWERDGDPDVTIVCDYDGTPLVIRWVCGWYEQMGDVDHDWSAANLIAAFDAASRALQASLDASRAARDTDTDKTCGTLPRKEQQT